MYWLISLPLIDESYDRTWMTLKQKTAQEIEWTSNYRQGFLLLMSNVPSLHALRRADQDLLLHITRSELF